MLVRGRAIAGLLVTGDYPGTIVSANQKRTVAIGRGGRTYVCAFVPGDVGRNDVAALAGVVRQLTDVSRKPGPRLRWESRVAKAQDSARELLSGKRSLGNVELLSYIAAHTAAGYGPVSMLLENPDIERIVVRGPRCKISVTHRTLGDCTTNMGFSSRESFLRAVSNLEDAAGHAGRPNGRHAFGLANGSPRVVGNPKLCA